MPASHTSFLLLDGTLARADPAWPSQAPGRVLDASRFAYSAFSGNGRIAGTTKLRGTPDSPRRARVRVFRERDAICVGEVFSDGVTGAYEFTGLDPSERYTVVAYDYTHTFRGSMADFVLPEVST